MKKTNIPSKSVVIVAHKFLTQPDDELCEYLRHNQAENVFHIRHSFLDVPERKSYGSWYKKGQLYREYETRDYGFLPEPFLYIKEAIFTLKWIWQSGIPWDSYIGMDGLCVLFGSILKYFGKVKQTIFWVIDFVPTHRFKQPWKNWVYHSINTHSYRHADQVWDLSPRMYEARKIHLGLQKSDYKKLLVVPYGMWVKTMKHYDYNECRPNSIVFMGHLIPKQGVQLILHALPLVIKKIPKAKFTIIGTGPFLPELKALAKELAIEKYCDFLGKIDDIRELEKIIARSGVAMAPYIKKLDAWSYYADPGKVKTYLGCGVPVLLTDIPWNAQEIQHQGCGAIITEEPENMARAVIKYLEPKLNQRSREQARRYALHFDYQFIFEQLSL